MVGELGLEVGEVRELFRPFLADAGECDEVFCCRLALLHFRGLSMLANCVFADRILSEYGVRDLVERGLVWNGLISMVFASVS